MRVKLLKSVPIRHGLLICTAWLATWMPLSAGADDLSREYRIKAAYLYNLTKFITWPDEKAWPADAPIALCVYGFNPFENYLDKLSQRTAKNRQIAVRYPAEPSELANCQIVFVSQYNTRSAEVLKVISGLPVLSVGDDPDFIAHNGLIGLIAAGNNVQMNIQLTHARQNGFTVSANLLEIVHKIE